MAESSEKAYRYIKEQILAGAYPRAGRIREQALVEQLKVSRTPVREALRRLASEGLVVVEANRGARVAAISADEMHELFELGATLESFAASLAAKRCQQSDVDQLQKLLRDMEKTLTSSVKQIHHRYTDLDLQFHSMIYKIAGNRRLENIARQLVGIAILADVFPRYTLSHFKQSLRHHEEITEALTRQDEDWAAAAMRNHILFGQHVRFDTGEELSG